MTLGQILDLAIKIGMQADPRTEKEVLKQLKRIKSNFSKLSPKEREYYPKEKLTNPYPDSLIHSGNPQKKIKKILMTIDVTEAKLLVARELGADAVIAHHPLGKSLALLGDAMKLQFYLYEKYGVPINIIEGINRKKIEEVKRSIHPGNHYLTVDTAKIISANLMNVHTPADNLVYNFLENRIKASKLIFVKDILKMLYEIPEYQEAAKRGSPPKLFAGSGKNHCGKVIASEITGGTDGGSKIYPHLANVGIGSVISMHQSEGHTKEAEKSFINVVVASHIASDSLGMNLFADELEKRGIEIIPTGGFIRVSRIKNKVGETINPV